MISLKINKVPVLFIQGFSRADAETIVDFVREANQLTTTYKDTVLFIDTPATPHLVEAIQHLKTEGHRVVFRDHHGVNGVPQNVRDQSKLRACEKLVKLLGEDCLITFREEHPACSTLVEVGEFKDALTIIADPDADGLTAAMKAAGLYYDGLDKDAALLDSEPALQITGSEISQLLAKGLATLPTYDSDKPRERLETQQKLFRNWVQAVEGNGHALEALQPIKAAYNQAVETSVQLAKSAKMIADNVVLADATNTGVYDVGTLNKLMEEWPDCRITVLKKDKGPIAALHGIQYSLAVAKRYQGKIDLRKLLPKEAENDPAGGIISNVAFLLHVSDSIWSDYVLPGLKAGIY